MAAALIRGRSRVGADPSRQQGYGKKKEPRLAPATALEGRRSIGDRYMFKGTASLKLIHNAAVTWVSWSHNNQKAVTASVDKSFAIWDITGDAKALRALKMREPISHIRNAHDGPVLQAVWRSDDRYIVTCGGDTTVRVWSHVGRKVCCFVGHLGPALGCAWSPDTRFIASGDNEGVVMVWDAQSAIDFAAQQRLVRSPAEMVDVAPRTTNGHTGAITRLVFSPSSDELLTASQDTSMRGWKIAQSASTKDGNKPYTMLLHKYIAHTDAVLGCAYNRNARRIASCSHDQTVRIWARQTGVCLHICEGHRNIVYDCAWFINELAEEAVVSCDHARRLFVWDGDGGLLAKAKTPHKGWTLCVAPAHQITPVAKGTVSTEPLRILTSSGDRRVVYFSPAHNEATFDCDEAVAGCKEKLRQRMDPEDGSQPTLCCAVS